MAAPRFSKGEAVRFGWKTAKRNVGFFAGLTILVGITHVTPWLITAAARQDAGLLPRIVSVASWLPQIVVQMGVMRIALRFCDGARGALSDLFSCFPLYFRYVLGSNLYALICFGVPFWAYLLSPILLVAALLLFAIPGIIWSMKYQFFGYFIVDRGVPAVKALRASARITRGAKRELFEFAILLVLINILGALCLGIGLFVTVPLSLLAHAFVYRKLLAATEGVRTAETLEAVRPRESVLRVLGSVQLTVTLSFLVAVALMVATLIENQAQAGRNIYHSWWFISLLGLFCLNLLLCTAGRWSFRAKKIGITVAHAGVLVMVVGVVIGAIWGQRGSVQLYIGQADDIWYLENNKKMKLPFVVYLKYFKVQRYVRERLVVYVVDRNLVRSFPMEVGKSFRVAGTPYSVTTLRYEPDFVVLGKGGFGSRSSEPKNPAVQVRVEDGSDNKTLWVFAKAPGMHQDPDSNVRLLYQRVEERIKNFKSKVLLLGEKVVLVVDDRPVETGYWGLSHPVFSPDGRHVAYKGSGTDGAWECVVVDGQPGPRYEALGPRPPVFHGDGTLEYLAFGDGVVYRVKHIPQAKSPPEKRSPPVGKETGTGRRSIFEERTTPPVTSSQRTAPLASKTTPTRRSSLFHDEPTSGRTVAVAQAAYQVEEEKVGTIDRSAFDHAKFSGDGLHIAYRVDKDGRWMVALDGKAGPDFQCAGLSGEYFCERLLALSSDAKRLAYAAVEAGKTFVVMDGRPGPAYDDVQDVTLSADGRRVAYVAKRGNKSFVVVDEQAGPELDEIRDPAFSPDGARFAYKGRVLGEQTYVLAVDGRPRPELGAVSDFVFSPDGKRMAYVAEKNSNRFVVLDGQGGPEFSNIEDLMFSADGKRFAYVGERVSKGARETILVVDGTLIRGVGVYPRQTFSADGKRLAYAAPSGDGCRVMLDGKPGPVYFDVLDLTFSPDGRRLAYCAREILASKTIEVNKPLRYQGFSMYQSAYDEQREMFSVLGIVKDPGLPLVYIGFAVISAGVLFNFYLRPILTGKARGTATQKAHASGRNTD